jgi:hypothetical protein
MEEELSEELLEEEFEDGFLISFKPFITFGFRIVVALLN